MKVKLFSLSNKGDFHPLKAIRYLLLVNVKFIEQVAIEIEDHIICYIMLQFVILEIFVKLNHCRWDTLDIETNPESPDAEQALIAGYIEGVDTSNAIYDHWYNTVSRECDNKTDLCEQINEYLYTNIEWVFKMVEKHAATDVYWRQVNKRSHYSNSRYK